MRLLSDDRDNASMVALFVQVRQSRSFLNEMRGE
jgi:hypothetical protein